jgi:hypothetical protein
VEYDKLFALALVCLIMLFAWLIGELFLRRRKQEEATPVTQEGLKQYDNLPAGMAVLMAWSESGSNPNWHEAMQEDVRKKMPVLARALDRLADTNS